MSSDLEQCHDDLAHARAEVQQLHTAIGTRAPIEQAKGILMTLLHNCDDDQAFRVLVKVSQQTHVKLADVAARLAEEVGKHDTLPDEFVNALR